MKILFPKLALLAILFSLIGCASFKKDNHPQEPMSVNDALKTQLTSVYRPGIKAQLDSHGLVLMDGSLGDSALFSCLARIAGAADFDPAILFVNGKPLRHPDIAPNADGSSSTPISKDMMDGILWCMHDLVVKGDVDHAHDLLEAMISFGKAHKFKSGADIGWLFCTDEDKANFHISSTDWLGKCWMAPAIIKDIYRIAKTAKVTCDADCKFYMALGTNVPADKTGFERHLAVMTTVRNGLVEGGLNDNSLKLVLQKAAEAEPRNALYQAAYHLFTDGDQSNAYAAAEDLSLFPSDALPTRANYCSPYLFQRDDDSASGKKEPDWLPCPAQGAPDSGRGVEWAVAMAMALGDLK